MVERVQFTNQASKDLQAYIEYNNIVGLSDGGKLMSDKDYQDFKRKKEENPINCSFKNPQGSVCKVVGPSSKCFCDHLLKDHVYDPQANALFCQAKGCACEAFSYLPIHGSQDFKCHCKHSYTDHNARTKKCRFKCAGCLKGFNSTWSCQCGYKYLEHKTVLGQRNMIEQEGFMGLVEGNERFENKQKQNMIQGFQQMSLQDETQYSQKSSNGRVAKNGVQQMSLQDQTLYSQQSQKCKIRKHSYLSYGSNSLEVNAYQLYNTPHRFQMQSIPQKVIKRVSNR